MPTAPVGSSPRVRGKRRKYRRWGSLCGLIPACAGKTLPLLLLLENNGAHPRVCGENLASGESWPLGVGSSPRVRGKHKIDSFLADLQGLIPACAGKTPPWSLWSLCPPAHPRVCGENRRSRNRRSERAGSSPRVRGKHRRRQSGRRRLGLIPACAGKTLPVSETR